MTDHHDKTSDATVSDAAGGLDLFFDAARATPPLPGGDFLTRIETQALEIQSAQQDIRSAARQPIWWQLLQTLGGWPGAAGLAAACAAGVWLGIAPPAALDGVLGSGGDLGTLGLDPLSGYDLAMMEG